MPEDKQSITVDYLMTGRSGLPDFFDTEDDWDPDLQWVDRETAIERMFSQELLFKPGADHKHSHGAFGLLAALIEKVSGMSYFDFIKKNFFDPAGMTKTGEYGQILGLSINDFAAGGGPNFVGIPNIPPNWGPTSWLVKGSGGMYSSLGDLQKFYEYIRSGRVLDNEHNMPFREATANLDGSDRGFELFSIYLPPNTEIYLFINEISDRSLLQQLMSALQRLIKSEHNGEMMK
ncbi:MAG: beta-lactamase family protein [Chloroflexia bacterium]|nr:beta-lactamase family protein [Chloroflexia bacterium]